MAFLWRCLLALTLTLSAVGSSAAAPLIQAGNAPDFRITVTRQADIIHDASGTLTAAELLTPELARTWVPINTPLLAPVAGVDVFWLRFTLFNSASTENTFVLRVLPQGDAPPQLFESLSGSAVTMYATPGAPRPLTLGYLNVKAGEQREYLLRLTSVASNIAVDIMDVEQMIRLEAIHRTLTLFLLTVTGMIFLGSFVAGIFYREYYYWLVTLASGLFLAADAALLGMLNPRLFGPGFNGSSLFEIASYAVSACSAGLMYRMRLHRPARWMSLAVAAVLTSNIAVALTLWAEGGGFIFLNYPLDFNFLGGISNATLICVAIAHYYSQGKPLGLAYAIIHIGIGCVYIGIQLGNKYSIGNSELLNNAVLFTNTLVLYLLVILLSIFLRSCRDQNIRSRLRAVASEAEARSAYESVNNFWRQLLPSMENLLTKVELLKDSPLGNRQRDWLNGVDLAAADMQERLEAFRSSDKNKLLKPTHSQFNFARLLEEILDDIRPICHQRSQNVLVDDGTGDRQELIGDRARIHQLFQHLLRTACVLASEGDIVIAIRIDQSSPCRLRVSLRWSGQQLSQEAVRALTGRESTHEINDNTATRLTMISQLCTDLSGSVELAANRGGNVKILCEFEVLRAALNPSETQRNLRGKRLFFLGHSPALAEIFERSARRWGLDTTYCENAVNAVAEYRRAIDRGAAPDIVLADLDSGNEPLRRLIAEQRAVGVTTTPVIGLVYNLDSSEADSIEQLGLNRILLKPVSTDGLFNAIAVELRSHDTNISAAKAEAKRGLVAVHDAAQAAEIAEALESLGWRCEIVGNGNAALQGVKTLQFDLLLMDCEMPIMDGASATAEIREWELSEERRPLRIIGLSDIDDLQLRDFNRRVGMNAHLLKPVSKAQLQSMIGDIEKAQSD